MNSKDIIKATSNSLNIYSFTAEALEKLMEAVKQESKRKWVGLTKKEIDNLYDKHGENGGYDYERAIEAKLKERNT